MAAISTAPIYTSQNPSWNYEAISYNMNELPTPLPARTDRLPCERKEWMEKERQDRNMLETQKAYDEAARQKARGGFFNNMAAAVKPRWAKLRTTPRPVREAIPSKRDERRFNNKFHFPTYERLLYASELCKTVSGQQQILGKVYVSENFFCFRESRLQPKGGRRQRLLLVIPIDDILSMSQAEIVSQPDPRYAPDFRMLEQWHSKADGIFLYTRDLKVHRFFGFWTQQTYHDTFNVLDRQWRTRPYTSTAPLRPGEPTLSRSMVPPINAAAPSVAVLQPSTFQPDSQLYSSTASRGLPIMGSSMRTASPYATFAEPTTAFIPASSTRGFSGKQAGKWGTSAQAQAQRRSLPSPLLEEIRHTSSSRLRHIGAPTPRFGHVLVDSDNRLQLVPLESLGGGMRSSFGQRSAMPQQQQFGLSSQGRQFRTGHYVPKQHVQQQWQQQPSSQWHQRGWQEKHHIPAPLANEIRHWDRHNLHHVQPPQYIPSNVPLGHVTERRTSAPSAFAPQQRLSRSAQQPGYVQRDRLGFQTVQQGLHAQQRGRALDPQLKDEIRFFNLRNLHHVRPTVRQWMPEPSDIKMRPRSHAAGGFQQQPASQWQQDEHKRRHRHKHHKGTEQDRDSAPVQVFQYEEYDISGPNKYERVQVTKFEDQLKRSGQQQFQQEQIPDRFVPTGGRTFEAGTA